MANVPIAVFIPTYNRGTAVFSVLEKIQACDPQPSEIWVHIDQADGRLEGKVALRFPEVKILTSPVRLGPGGGRHRCLSACTTPYAVGFDDDSYPVDRDFFSRVERLLSTHPAVAVFGASIWHRNEPEKPLDESLRPTPSYIGCGYAIRVAAYRQLRGYLSRPIPYGIEESDLSLQLFAAGWRVCEASEMRVFHDTELKHHSSPEITSSSITNVGLYAFLNYPIVDWSLGLLQLVNKVVYCARMGRFRGIGSGIVNIPKECIRYRRSPQARFKKRTKAVRSIL